MEDPEMAKPTNLYFGAIHQDTLAEFDELQSIEKIKNWYPPLSDDSLQVGRQVQSLSSMNNKSSKRSKNEARVAFLRTQTGELDHYLPETYQMLMEEMYRQQRDLIAHKIQEFY